MLQPDARPVLDGCHGDIVRRLGIYGLFLLRGEADSIGSCQIDCGSKAVINWKRRAAGDAVVGFRI